MKCRYCDPLPSSPCRGHATDRGKYYRGDLVWIQGPHPARRVNDIAIFYKVLRHFLEPGERVEADNGYDGAADKIKCPDNPCNPVENEGMQSRARYCHEPIIGHFKTWGILQHTYHHDIRRHGEVFREIAIMAQLAISNGSSLFSVEYKDSIGTVVNNKIND